MFTGFPSVPFRPAFFGPTGKIATTPAGVEVPLIVIGPASMAASRSMPPTCAISMVSGCASPLTSPADPTWPSTALPSNDQVCGAPRVIGVKKYGALERPDVDNVLALIPAAPRVIQLPMME